MAIKRIEVLQGVGIGIREEIVTPISINKKREVSKE